MGDASSADPSLDAGPGVGTAGGVTAVYVLLTLFVLGSVLGAVGMVQGVAVPLIRSEAADARSKLDRRRLEHERSEETRALLDTVATQLEIHYLRERVLPGSLQGSPPEDAWGNPLRYERRGADWAELTSAGPDGRLDTGDDLSRRVQPR